MTPAEGGRPALRWLSVVAQLALVLWVAKVYRIEELRLFDRLLPVLFAAFVAHSLAPRRLRLPIFVAASWTAAGVVLGAGSALWLVGAGLALIGICHLPVSYRARIPALLAACTALAVARAGRLPLPEAASSMLPILGSMFMIRMIIYAYDLRHGREPKGWARIAYFFLLPNVCFPLFPAVDARAFARSWYDGGSFRIYQKGLAWIARGILQIVLYRLVYLHVLPAPTAVTGFASLVLFTVGSYFIYVRISGIFHLAVGILCLFGFDLPPTHRRYFLASSFTDFWHRINIYWTAFMTKVVYYPVMMRFRKGGAVRATALAVVAVFASTTLLHAYQWFWLRGSFLVTANDAAFFGALGLLVLVPAVREAAGRRRRSAPGGSALRRSFQTVGVFCVISVLWAMWNAPSISDWWRITVANAGTIREWAALAAALAAVAAGGALVARRIGEGGGIAEEVRRPAYVVATSAVLLLAATTEVQERLGSRIGSVLATIDDDRFSQRDEEQIVRGYYEGLLELNRLNSRVWEVELRKPVDEESLRESAAVTRLDGVPGYELIPSKETAFRDTVLRTNRWGMRDIEYERVKPPGTHRVALLGSSYVMGWGVDGEDVFESVLERRLNAEGGGARWEILNFAVGGYTLADQVALCRRRVPDFEPDTVIYVAHTGMRGRELERLAEYFAEGAAERSDVLQDLRNVVALNPDLPVEEIRRHLRGEWPRLVAWSYREMVAACRSRGAEPVHVFLPKIRQIELEPADRELIQAAEEAGFRSIVLDSVYGNWDGAAIQVAPWDFHPNALGHRLIAEALFARLELR